ncbi:hypothetical protein D9757_005655 [Collybiopsis confluens]|uniref:Uncharacterized protein n=1 Tax=Collybiopsis confluens TaxID=2823264 RepID=A0A8H5HSQ4_9AGAR|nr:hypothetical protein D9757_005655 [Collybiopsis confluens]
MKPIRPKMKKVLLTGFVACMSLFNASSAAPVPHRSSRPTESPSSASTTPTTADIIETAAVGPPSPPSPATTPSSARQAPPSSGNRSRRARGSGGDTSPSSNAHPSVARPSSFSLASLGLGPIDYAAASIARRVSRIFVKRMSAQSGARIPTTTTTMTTQTETAGGEDNNE